MATQERTPPLTDEQLVGRIAAGDEKALGQLFDRHGSLVFGLALALMRDRTEAEEVVAEAFAQVWRNAAGFQVERGSAGGWLATIARSRALDRLRAHRRSDRLYSEAARGRDDGFVLPLYAPAAADKDLERSDNAALVRQSLAALPAPQRRALELAYFGGLSQSEIATELREPLGTVKTRIRSGMEKMRQMLQPLLDGGAP